MITRRLWSLIQRLVFIDLSNAQATADVLIMVRMKQDKVSMKCDARTLGYSTHYWPTYTSAALLG